jgi:hypothetical protein
MASTIVKATENKIKNPDKTITKIGDISVKVLPFSDIVFSELSEVISQCVNSIGAIQIIIEAAKEGGGLDIGLLAQQIPGVIKVLAPASTKILALSLRVVGETEPVGVDWINENVYGKDRIRLLQLALEVNGVAEMLGEIVGAAMKLIPQSKTPTDPSADSTLMQ